MRAASAARLSAIQDPGTERRVRVAARARREGARAGAAAGERRGGGRGEATARPPGGRGPAAGAAPSQPGAAAAAQSGPPQWHGTQGTSRAPAAASLGGADTHSVRPPRPAEIRDREPSRPACHASPARASGSSTRSPSECSCLKDGRAMSRPRCPPALSLLEGRAYPGRRLWDFVDLKDQSKPVRSALPSLPGENAFAVGVARAWRPVVPEDLTLQRAFLWIHVHARPKGVLWGRVPKPCHSSAGGAHSRPWPL
jgi:hypothetical protein